MSADLVKYSAAKKALAEAHRVDEVKDIRDKAVAMRMYAMQAKDGVLIHHATEIRLRAERRAGELLKDMDKNKGAVAGKTGRKARPLLDMAPKLSDLNISKSQSSKWQKLAGIPDGDFEQVVASAQHKASAAVDRAQQSKPKSKKSTAEAAADVPASEPESEPAPDAPKTEKAKSRPVRWDAAVSAAAQSLGELKELQTEYADWRESLPDNLREGPVAEKFAAVEALDFESAIATIEEAETVDLPVGFGRD
jgi:hypothetical protein